jgi:UPF0716 protein FxsA
MILVKWGIIGAIVLPFAEVAAFALVATTFGWFWAAALFVGTSIVGLLILKHMGRGEFDRFRTAVNRGGIRAINLETPGLARIAGAILLVLPGFITDALGALLFVAPFRRWASAAVGQAQAKRRAAQNPSVIDLAPEEWHQVPDTPDDQAPARKRSRGRKRED